MRSRALFNDKDDSGRNVSRKGIESTKLNKYPGQKGRNNQFVERVIIPDVRIPRSNILSTWKHSMKVSSSTIGMF